MARSDNYTYVHLELQRGHKSCPAPESEIKIFHKNISSNASLVLGLYISAWDRYAPKRKSHPFVIHHSPPVEPAHRVKVGPAHPLEIAWLHPLEVERSHPLEVERVHPPDVERAHPLETESVRTSEAEGAHPSEAERVYPLGVEGVCPLEVEEVRPLAAEEVHPLWVLLQVSSSSPNNQVRGSYLPFLEPIVTSSIRENSSHTLPISHRDNCCALQQETIISQILSGNGGFGSLSV